MKHDQRRRCAAMEILISGISSGDHPFHFDLPASEIDLGESFLGNVRVSGVMQKFATHIVLHGTASAVSTRNCDRCLASSDVIMEIPLDLYYLEGAVGDHGGSQEDEGESRTLRPDQESIVLDDEIREGFLVQIPLQALCRNDCLGICPGCGVDLNTESCSCTSEQIDPRWAKLADVFKQKPGGN